VLYFETKELQAEWVFVLKQAAGTKNIFDFYQLKDILGQG